MEANLYIDVTLLAIALSMHVSKRDRRLVLLTLVVLFGHIILTSPSNTIEEEVLEEEEDEPLGAPTETVNAPTLDQILDKLEPVEKKGFTNDDFVKSTVSSGVFDRQISTPQNMLTTSIFPNNSKEANGKLADARGSFFNSLVA